MYKNVGNRKQTGKLVLVGCYGGRNVFVRLQADKNGKYRLSPEEMEAIEKRLGISRGEGFVC